MQQRERVAVARVGADRAPLEQRRRERRRPVQQLGALRGVRRGEPRLEQLADHPEGEPGLELAAARREHGHAGAGRVAAQLVDQPRLADPGRPFDRHERAASLAGGGQPPGQAGEVVVPFDELRLRRGRSHLARFPRRSYAARARASRRDAARLTALIRCTCRSAMSASAINVNQRSSSMSLAVVRVFSCIIALAATRHPNVREPIKRVIVRSALCGFGRRTTRPTSRQISFSSSVCASSRSPGDTRMAWPSK